MSRQSPIGRFPTPSLDPRGVWWLEQALAHDPGVPCPPLNGDVNADVCVVGGGYTGLWTAIEIREQAPDTRVVLIEASGCGFGASGRNGGFASGWYDELDNLIHTFGVDEGLRLAARGHWAIGRVGDFTAEHGIDCQFRQQGSLRVATTTKHAGRWSTALSECRDRGFGHLLEEIDAAGLEARTGSGLVLAAVRQVDAAAVQPALLVRGLRRVALNMGVEIYEHTPMTGLVRARPVQVQTPKGRLTADRVVLATNVWSARIRELRRTIAIVGSHLIATEPVGDRLDGTRFRAGEPMSDSRATLHYMQATAEGRIVFGKAGAAIGSSGRVPAKQFHDPERVAIVAADFRRWFPQLRELKIEYGWGGSVDRAPGHLPFIGTLGDHANVLYGLGYSGNGVAPSALIGRVLGRLALGMSDEDTRSGLTSGPRGYLPVEPLRSAGGALVRWGATRADDSEERGETPDVAARVLRSLVTASVPRPLEPRLWHKSGAHDARRKQSPTER